MSMKQTFVVFIALVALLIASSCLYVVNETERAVKLKFGEVVDPDIQPGLHFKIPVMHRIRKFDARILTFR